MTRPANARSRASSLPLPSLTLPASGGVNTLPATTRSSRHEPRTQLPTNLRSSTVYHLPVPHQIITPVIQASSNFPLLAINGLPTTMNRAGQHNSGPTSSLSKHIPISLGIPARPSFGLNEGGQHDPTATPSTQAPPAHTKQAATSNHAQISRLAQQIFEKYCANNTNHYQQAIMISNRDELKQLIAQANAALKELKSRQDTVAELIKEQDAQKSAVNAKVIAFYAEMKPESAAQQLNSMEEARVRAILTALPSKVASQILNEMNPRRAAQITQSMFDSTSSSKPAER